MKTTKNQIVNIITRPQAHHGIDWSCVQNVIVRTYDAQRELLWYKSGKCWQDRMSGQIVTPTRLVIMDWANRHVHRYGMDLHSGGRFSRALIAEHAGVIDAFFKCDVSAEIRANQTIIVPNIPKVGAA